MKKEFDSNQYISNNKELTLQELKNLVKLCKQIESMRAKGISKGFNNDNQALDERFNISIRQAVKTLNQFKVISYQGVMVESGYDRHSQNYYTVCHTWNNDSWNPENYSYTGNRESCSIGHVWMIIEKFGNLFEDQTKEINQ